MTGVSGSLPARARIGWEGANPVLLLLRPIRSVRQSSVRGPRILANATHKAPPFDRQVRFN